MPSLFFNEKAVAVENFPQGKQAKNTILLAARQRRRWDQAW